MRFANRLTALLLALLSQSASAAAPLYFNLSDIFGYLLWLIGIPVLLALLIVTRRGYRYLTAAVFVVWATAPAIAEFAKRRGEEREAELGRRVFRGALLGVLPKEDGEQPRQAGPSEYISTGSY